MAENGEAELNGKPPAGAAAAVTEGPPPGRRLFAYAGFDTLFLGSLTGKLADRVYQMALVAAATVIFSGGASEDAGGEIYIYGTIPLVIGYPVMSSLIDSADRRLLLWASMGIRAVLVLAFIWLLAPVTQTASANNLAGVAKVWWLALALVALTNFCDSPFGPARAAAVPDVAPKDQRGLAASLMATSGLISMLLGSLLGGYVAQTRHFGPANTVFIAVGLYLVSALLLRTLPASVAEPLRLRNKIGTAETPVAGGLSLRGYFTELAEGFKYAWRTTGIWELVVFETLFWCVASAFYLLYWWHLRSVMHLRPDDITGAISVGLGAAGVGLFLGAVTAGKSSRTVSPIVSYVLALLIMGLGAGLVFSSRANVTEIPGSQAPLQLHDRVMVRGPGVAIRPATVDSMPQTTDTVLVRFSETETAPVPRADVTLLLSSFPYMVMLYLLLTGLGGGLLLGRVDADVLAIAAEHVRGRVFSIKATAFTLALLATMGPLSVSGDAIKGALAHWYGLALMLCAIPALVMSWRVDMAIWAWRNDLDQAGPLHRFCYEAARDTFKLWLIVYYRYKVIGAEKIPKQGPVILVANHASFIDPLFLGCSTKRIVQYIIHAHYYRSFGHPLFRLVRTIPVDDVRAVAALRAGVRALAQGGCVGLYPEGHVSDDGRLQPGQPGALFLAQHSGAQVVPVAIKGNFGTWPRGAWLPRPGKVTVIIGDPFTVSKDASRKEIAERTDELMRNFAATLGLQASK